MWSVYAVSATGSTGNDACQDFMTEAPHTHHGFFAFRTPTVVAPFVASIANEERAEGRVMNTEGRIMNTGRTGSILLGLLVATVVAALPASAQDRKEAEVLLQAAVHVELVEGDLERAIQLYQEIVAKNGNNHAVAAAALVNLGRSYEKLGSSEARRAYERVLRDYVDQREQVAVARARLAALRRPTRTAAPSGVVVRQVWAGPGVDAYGAPSSDGRYLTFVDWSTGDLAIRDMAAGENRRLTNKGSWSESAENAQFSVLSPDGEQVAYAWFNEDLLYDLRLVGIDGSKPRVLYRDDEVEYLQPAGWSPDGTHILALLSRKDRTNQIAWVSAMDGSVQVVKTLDRRNGLNMSLSPDGRYIAYDFPPAERAPARDIFLLSTDGSRETPLVEHPANDRFPMWAPDGESIVFGSDRAGSLDAWVIQVVDGRPQGSPQVVKQDIGRVSRMMGFTRNGALYYGKMSWVSTGDVYTATLDFAAGEPSVPPTPVSERFVGSNIAPDWSPDGEYLVYVSRRGAPGSRSQIMAIRTLETGRERELPLPVTQLVTRPRWSPDGAAFLVVGRDSKAHYGLYRIDAEAGDATPIVQFEPGVLILWAAWALDGRAVFYLRADPIAKVLAIVRRDLDTGQERNVEGVPAWSVEVALSPDGRQLALIVFNQEPATAALMVMPAAGGEPRELLRVEAPELIKGGMWEDGLAWAADGRHVLFGKFRVDDQEQIVEWWRIPVEGGEAQKIGLAMANLRDVRVHPDGQRIAFTAGKFINEVWVMEHFLPERE